MRINQSSHYPIERRTFFLFLILWTDKSFNSKTGEMKLENSFYYVILCELDVVYISLIEFIIKKINSASGQCTKHYKTLSITGQ